MSNRIDRRHVKYELQSDLRRTRYLLADCDEKVLRFCTCAKGQNKKHDNGKTYTHVTYDKVV